MLIGDLLQSGPIATLELTAKFAGARQRTIMSNVANISTPNYIPYDLSPTEFQRTLRAAVEQRRASGMEHGPLRLRGSNEVKVDARGEAQFTPTSASGNILFHDRNNRDLERMMQANAENAGVFRVAVDLLRSRYEVLRSAIAERA